MKALGSAALGVFVLIVWVANWAFTRWGNVPVAPDLEAPAAVWFVGIAFTLRDIAHRQLGRWWVVGGIVAGALLSYFVQGGGTIPGGLLPLAVASGLAFLLSETADLIVYEPLRTRGWFPAVLASNAVGLVVDSLLFLWLAVGGLGLLWGQVVGKAWMTALAVTVLAVVGSRKPVPA